jgi:hypothetical protein
MHTSSAWKLALCAAAGDTFRQNKQNSSGNSRRIKANPRRLRAAIGSLESVRLSFDACMLKAMRRNGSSCVRIMMPPFFDVIVYTSAAAVTASARGLIGNPAR